MNLSQDEMFELLATMDLNQISSICQASKSTHELCASDRFNKLIVENSLEILLSSRNTEP